MSNVSTLFNCLVDSLNFHDGYWIEQLYEIDIGEYESVSDYITDAYEQLSPYEKCELVRRLAIEGKKRVRDR